MLLSRVCLGGEGEGGGGVAGRRWWGRGARQQGTAVSSPQTATSGVIFQQVTCRLQAWSPGLNWEPVGGSDREQLRTAWRRPPGAGPALCWAVCGGCLSPAQSSPRREAYAPFTDRGVGEAVRLAGPQALGRPGPLGQQSFHKGQMAGVGAPWSVGSGAPKDPR